MHYVEISFIDKSPFLCYNISVKSSITKSSKESPAKSSSVPRHDPKRSKPQSGNPPKPKKANKTQKKALPNTGASAQVRQCLIILPIPHQQKFQIDRGHRKSQAKSCSSTPNASGESQMHPETHPVTGYTDTGKCRYNLLTHPNIRLPPSEYAMGISVFA